MWSVLSTDYNSISNLRRALASSSGRNNPEMFRVHRDYGVASAWQHFFNVTASRRNTYHESHCAASSRCINIFIVGRPARTEQTETGIRYLSRLTRHPGIIDIDHIDLRDGASSLS